MMENVVRASGKHRYGIFKGMTMEHIVFTADFFDGSVEDAIEEFKEKYAIEKVEK